MPTWITCVTSYGSVHGRCDGEGERRREEEHSKGVEGDDDDWAGEQAGGRAGERGHDRGCDVPCRR